MMEYVFYSVIMVISVNLLIGLYKEFLEHGRTHECALLAAPVVMMEDCFRMQMIADTFCKAKLKLRQHFNHVVQLVRRLVHSHQRIINLAHMVALLEKAGSYKGCLHRLVAYRVIHLLALAPLFIRKVGIRHFYIILPVINIFYQNMFFILHREPAGSIRRESIINTPCIGDGILYLGSLRDKGRPKQKRMKQKSNPFVLVYNPVRFATLNGFYHILSCC